MSWAPWSNHDLAASPGTPSLNTGPQVFRESPAAVARSTDFINVYARGSDDRLLQSQWSRHEGWSWWRSHGDDPLLRSSPGVGSRNGDHECVAVRGPDDRLRFKEWHRDSGWSTWASLGETMPFVDSPAVVCRSNDVINVYARGRDARLHQIYWDSTHGWRPNWQLHPQDFLLASAPAAVSLGPDHEVVFAQGLEGRLWSTEWRQGEGWSVLRQLGGTTRFRGYPAAIARNPDAINVYARSENDAVIQITWERERGWHPAWQRHDDSSMLSSAPTAARLGDQAEMLFVRRTDGRLWSKWWDWSGVRRLPLHLRYVADPAEFRFTTDEVKAATQLVFAGALVSASIVSVERLATPSLRDINVGACQDWGIFTTFNFGQRALFANRDGVGPDEIVVYFVRSASGFLGCPVHPDDRPGVLVAAPASVWTAAHEICHVLGLGHEGSSDQLMFPGRALTNLPPNLGVDQVGEGRFVRRS